MSEKSTFSCKNCAEHLDIINSTYLQCERCEKCVHLNCLPNNLITSGIAGDVFYQYTCLVCSDNNEDIVVREKITWFLAVVLAMNDMASKCSGISNQGYFHWRTHITGFIDRNWQILFSSNFKRRKNWLGTIAGVLSHHSPSFFLSGAAELGDAGWWKLAHNLQPSVFFRLYNDVTSIRNKERKDKKNKTLATPDEDIVLRLLKDYGLKNHFNIFNNNIKLIKMQINNDTKLKREKEESDSDDEDINPTKRPFLQFSRKSPNNYFKMSAEEQQGQIDFSTNQINDDGGTSMGSFEEFDIGFDDSHVDSILGSDDILNWSFNENNFMTNFEMSDDESSTSNSQPYVKTENKSSKENLEELPLKSLFNVREKPRVLPWTHFIYEENSSQVNLKPLSVYQEHETHRKLKQYLQIIDNNSSLLKKVDPKKLCEARRLCCKLNVRKLLRKQNQKEFDLDRLMLGEKLDGVRESVSTRSDVNVLDKFQVVTTPDDANASFATRLTGSCVWSTFVSPYTNRMLKPFIRRDCETISHWMKLMGELQLKVNCELTGRAPIDYCYVRPHHIAAINSLCEQFYWPGIDVTDVLQYPDYTVVALYKKLVVGFGLLVPDASHNEAYISFLWTRPNWQKSGIGSFMLYHLIQTCVGKDITLHVSATNTALILYQKFGFKVEEFIQDFYDKYMPITSKECRHALYLRLSR